MGAGRHFKMDVKNRLLVLLGYYCRLYTTYPLAGFLFDLDQSNVCRDIQKIESLVRKCLPIPQKTHRLSKRMLTPEGVEKMFPGFLSFIDRTEQQIPMPHKKRRKAYYSGKKKRHTVNTHSWLTTRVSSFTKQATRKEKGMTTTSIKIITL